LLLTGNNLEGETTLVLDGWLKCVVEGGSVVRDFRDVVSRKVSDLLSGKDLGNDGTALLSGLEALSALEASALPEKYKRQPPPPKKKVARKSVNSKWRTKQRQARRRSHYVSGGSRGGSHYGPW